jgi:outer membrane protein assembly factor BamB
MRPALAILIVSLTSAPTGANWPQWRGPSGLGVSAESGLPATWSARENVAWNVTLAGLGSSSPIVWNDQVIVTSQNGSAPRRPGSHPMLARDDAALVARERPIGGQRDVPPGADGAIELVVESFSRTDGRRLWEHRFAAKGPFPELHEKHNLATPTPVTDGKQVFAWFGTGQVVALDMNGTRVWARHLGEEYSPFDINWGHGSSPVLYRDLLILLCDHESDAYLLALDARTGRERWKADRGAGRSSFSTPLVASAPGGDELIVNSSERIDAYDPATGALLWHADAPRQTPIPSAVAHEGVVYLTRGYRNSPYLAIRPGGRGDVSTTHVIWRAPGGGSYVPSLVYYDGLLYLTNDVGVLTCADAKTGERVWQMRLDGVFFASPVAADGRVYFVSQTGETVVVRAGRTPEILARNDLGERLVASPAISGRRIFLRSDARLFAIGKTVGAPAPQRPAVPYTCSRVWNRSAMMTWSTSPLWTAIGLNRIAWTFFLPLSIVDVPSTLSPFAICTAACAAPRASGLIGL